MSGPGEEPVKILLVDDRPTNLSSLAAVLDRPDYNLVLASSGEEALAKVLRDEFAVILLDVAMPKMDGLETAQLIKQRERSRHIPILFVTASVYDISSIARAYESGAVDYLQKPLEPLLVRAKVSVFVELFRQRKQIEQQAALLRHSERREHQHEVRRREGERRRFLDEASEMLFASLDQQETLKALAALIPTKIPDLCAVYSIAEDRLVLAESAVASPEMWGTYERLNFEETVSLDCDARLTDAMARGRAWGLPPVPDGGLSVFCGAVDPRAGGSSFADDSVGGAVDNAPAASASLAPGAALPAAAGEIAPRDPAGPAAPFCGALFVPLKGKARVFGGVLVVRVGGAMEEECVSLCEELARRATIALDNARLFEEATSAVQLRDEFLSIASHELRTPLTALHLFLQRMEQLLVGPLEPEVLSSKVRGATRQIDRLTRLVESLLDVSRIRTGRLDLHLESMDAAALVSELVDRFRDQASRVGAELRLKIEGHLEVTWDRLRIEQVLDNLVSNALKYAPGLPVEIGAASEAEGIRIWVRDRGMGISADDLARVFGRFERAVPLRHYGGLGLGLYIAQQIARAHGGEIEVASKKGQGACFILHLPVDARMAEAEERPGETSTWGPAGSTL